MDAILALLKSSRKAMDTYQIADALGFTVDDAQRTLIALTESGGVILTKKGKYALPEDMGLVAARTMVLRSGTPVARPLSGERDMLISERGTLRPMLDDLILVRPGPHYGDGMGKCQLAAITKRAQQTFTAVLALRPTQTEEPPRRGARKGKRSRQAPTRTSYLPDLRPTDPRLGTGIQLMGELMGARSGDMLLLRMVRWPERGVKPGAVVARVLGDADDIQVQLRAIASRHNISEAFPDDALREAAALPGEVSPDEVMGRMDLRSLVTFTIDGEDAQDFDDAISLERTEDGFRLGVHIADVSHYVRPQGTIDREALERGTSTYLPGLTLPMLPEALCNRMCSLMPDVDRLTLSVMMDVKDGQVVSHTLATSVIHSTARLTYTAVNHMLRGEQSDVPEALHRTLEDMVRIASALRERREARGSIDFDMPEAAFTLDAQGRPTDVRARERGESERMIEDFMLIANETVAQMARSVELPLLYRVHAEPEADRVRALEVFLRGLGIKAKLGSAPRPMHYQQILRGMEGMPEAGLIQQVMLKSLRRAEYSASPDGHFGLAARDYCHFTAPIRRYPDLVVHRMLKLMLLGKTDEYARQEARMPQLAEHCSFCEQRSTLAERDADDLLKAHYMAQHIGEVFDGLVTGVTSWGLYVTLANTVEGLIPLRTLMGDWQLDAERHTLLSSGKRRIRLGDPLRIMVERVGTALAQIDFALVEGEQ